MRIRTGVFLQKQNFFFKKKVLGYKNIKFNLLLKPLVGHHCSGRNNSGKITFNHRGGGCKNLIRVIDYKRSLLHIPATVINISYDPNRFSFLALLKYDNNVFSYIIAPEGLIAGMRIVSGYNVDRILGNSMPLRYCRVGDIVFNVEKKPFFGGKIARAAGTFIRIVSGSSPFFGDVTKKKQKNKFLKRKVVSNITLLSSNNNTTLNFINKNLFLDNNFSNGNFKKKKHIFNNMLVKFCQSNTFFRVDINSMITVGIASNSKINQFVFRTAGFSRRKNKRPVVRGVAMNPIDHPHGGGEGKTSAGRPSVSPWGWLTKLCRKPRKKIIRLL
jgi:ribosomal protein L2